MFVADTLIFVALLCITIGCSFNGSLAAKENLLKAGEASLSASKDNSSYWVSENGELTIGFKSLSLQSYLLCIWMSSDSNRTALWWPNISNPNSVLSEGATFNFTSQGSLELSDSKGGGLLWSTNTTGLNASFAELSNRGNLLVLDGNNQTLWESFSDLRDSLMIPSYGTSSDVALVINKSYLLQSRENESSYWPGRFHIATDASQTLYVHAWDTYYGFDYIYIYASMNVSGYFSAGENFGKEFVSNASLPMSRLTLDYDGNLRIYSWNSSANRWQDIWQLRDYKCLIASPCGPFGICNQNGDGSINCTCPPGYHAVDEKDDSKGCSSNLNFSAICVLGVDTTNGSFSMIEMDGSDYNYNDINSGSSTADVNECKNLCLNDCGCVAAAYQNSGVCYTKGKKSPDFLMNGYTKSSSTLLMKNLVIASSTGQGGNRGGLVTGLVVGTAALVVILCCMVWLFKRRRRLGAAVEIEVGSQTTGPIRFTYKQLVEATDNFSHLLGEGGYGKVYKGWIKGKTHTGNERVTLAVKVLKRTEEANNDAAGKQFRAEVSTLGKIHHVNLVILLGYYAGEKPGEKKVLVYEYVERGSLDNFLYADSPEPLTWATRYSIALGTARGIAYLHHDCNPHILHCDIKPQNVLLDKEYTAKVADFGLSKHFQQQKSHLTVSGMRGTRGYMAPEWLKTDEVTSKVDVYSFGVLVLELVRGMNGHACTDVSLVEWAYDSISGISHSEDITKHNHETVANMHSDPALSPESRQIKLKLLKVGLWCIQYVPSLRPSMSQVLHLIEGTNDEIEEPPYPIPQMFNTQELPFVFSSGTEKSTSNASAGLAYNSFISAR